MSKRPTKITPAVAEAIAAEVRAQLSKRLPRFVKLDSSNGMSAAGLHTLDLGCDARHGVIFIAAMGGAVSALDLASAERGIVKVRFEKFTRLEGAWVFPPAEDDA